MQLMTTPKLAKRHYYISKGVKHVSLNMTGEKPKKSAIKYVKYMYTRRYVDAVNLYLLWQTKKVNGPDNKKLKFQFSVISTKANCR